MSLGKLSPLQERVLVRLADIRPPWTLTGGGALAGFYTQHRETRDLDLFFREQRVLGEIVSVVRQELERDGLEVATLRTSPTFSQLAVGDGADRIVLDLVADPTPIAEQPSALAIGTTSIFVDTQHQLLVNKLCALLSRAELRDLVDVRELLARGGDLRRALEDCPQQDAGFSPLTFGWSMRGLPVRRLASAVGWPEADVEALERFRDDLLDRVLASARPPEPVE